MRAHSMPKRYALKPSLLSRPMSSGQRWKLSAASPLGSVTKVPGRFSMAHQSLETLFPSIWWAEVAAPMRKPSGSTRPDPVEGVMRKLLPRRSRGDGGTCDSTKSVH